MAAITVWAKAAMVRIVCAMAGYTLLRQFQLVFVGVIMTGFTGYLLMTAIE